MPPFVSDKRRDSVVLIVQSGFQMRADAFTLWMERLDQATPAGVLLDAYCQMEAPFMATLAELIAREDKQRAYSLLDRMAKQMSELAKLALEDGSGSKH